MDIVALKNKLIRIVDDVDQYISYRIISIEEENYNVKKVDIYNNEVILKSIDSKREILLSFEVLSKYLTN